MTFAVLISNVYAGRFKKREAKNVRTFFVKEPVFNGKVYVSESGVRNVILQICRMINFVENADPVYL